GIREDLVTGVQTCALPICGEHDAALRRLRPAGSTPPRRCVPALVPARGPHHYFFHLRFHPRRRGHGLQRAVTCTLTHGETRLIRSEERRVAKASTCWWPGT